jgi:hypothetical protein
MSSRSEKKMTKTKTHKPPSEVYGTPVYQSGDPLEVNGESWVTLVPEDDKDERIWEFSVTTGRLMKTR